MSDISEVLKGKIPIGWIRVSSSAQQAKGTGPASQKKMILDWLKLNGIKKQPIWYQEQISGGAVPEARKQLDAMISFIMEQKDPSKYFVVMRDYKRWARHGIYGGWSARMLYDNGVEIVSAVDNAAVGHSSRPDANGEFMFALWMALGALERAKVAETIAGGIERAKKIGRIGGQPLDPDMAWETLIANYYRFGLPRSDPNKMGYKKAVEKWKVKRGWVRGAYQRFKAFEDTLVANDIEVQPELDKWLEVMERLREVKRMSGEKSDHFREARAQTSGILKRPDLYWSMNEKVGSKKAFAELGKQYQS